MEAIVNVFEPEIIGIDVKKCESAISAWQSYLDSLNDLAASIAGFLDEDTLSTEDLLKIVQADPDTILVRLHKMRGDISNGMNPEKVVKLGIVSNIYSGDISENLNNYRENKKYAESLFRYKFNVAVLANEDGVLSITDDFKTAVKETFTKYTKTEDENEALKNINLIISGINYFVGRNFLNISRGASVLVKIINMIKMDNSKTKFDIDFNSFVRSFRIKISEKEGE